MRARCPTIRRASVAVALFGAGALFLNTSSGCKSGCTPAHDESEVMKLGAFSPESDAGTSRLPWCSACTGAVSPGNSCEASCAISPPNPGDVESSDEPTCLVDQCVATVRDPKSSCDVVCRALLPDTNITGRLFAADRSEVTCTYHLEEDCRCDLLDC